MVALILGTSAILFKPSPGCCGPSAPPTADWNSTAPREPAEARVRLEDNPTVVETWFSWCAEVLNQVTMT